MVTPIPVRWLESTGWRVRINLPASGSRVGSWTFNVQRSTFNFQGRKAPWGHAPLRGLPQQNAKNAEGGARLNFAPALSCASFDGNDEFVIENLIIFARRLFKHKHRLARGTEHKKILMVDPQLAPVSQGKSDGLPVGPNGFNVLNFHARKTLADVPSVFHSDPRLKTGGQGRFKIGVGTARPQHLDGKRKLRGDGPSPPLLGRIPESTLTRGRAGSVCPHGAHFGRARRAAALCRGKAPILYTPPQVTPREGTQA